MRKVASIIRRIDEGRAVSVVRTRDGRDRVEFRRVWSPLKSVVALSSYEMDLVEVALSARRSRKARVGGRTGV
jgi:hypothetical protein